MLHNTDSRIQKISFLGSGIPRSALEYGILLKESRIQVPLTRTQTRNPVTQNPQHGVQNSSLSWIALNKNN